MGGDDDDDCGCVSFLGDEAMAYSGGEMANGVGFETFSAPVHGPSCIIMRSTPPFNTEPDSPITPTTVKWQPCFPILLTLSPSLINQYPLSLPLSISGFWKSRRINKHKGVSFFSATFQKYDKVTGVRDSEISLRVLFSNGVAVILLEFDSKRWHILKQLLRPGPIPFISETGAV